MFSFRKKRFISIKVVIFMIAISWAFPLHVLNLNGEHMCTIDDVNGTDLVADVKEKVRRRTKFSDFDLASQDAAFLKNRSTLADCGITTETNLTFVKNSDARYWYEPDISNEELQLSLREEKTTHVSGEVFQKCIAETGKYGMVIGAVVPPGGFLIRNIVNILNNSPPSGDLDQLKFLFIFFGTGWCGFWAGWIAGTIVGAAIGSIAKASTAIRAGWKRKISVMSFQEGTENWIIKVPHDQRRRMRALKRSDLERRMRSWRHSQRHPTGYWFYEIEELSMEQILDLVFPKTEGYEHKKYRTRKYRCMRSYQHWNKKKIITYLQEVWKLPPANNSANDLALGMLDV